MKCKFVTRCNSTVACVQGHGCTSCRVAVAVLSVIVDSREIAKVKNKQTKMSNLMAQKSNKSDFELSCRILLPLVHTALSVSRDPLVSSAISVEMGTHLQPVLLKAPSPLPVSFFLLISTCLFRPICKFTVCLKDTELQEHSWLAQ